MKIKRFIYLGYYIRKLDRHKLRKFVRYTSEQSGRSKLSLLLASVGSVFKDNTSILDYFFFSFVEKDKEERKQWAGTGYMFEYQKKMNPEGVRDVLENKILFNQHFRPYLKRGYFTSQQLLEDQNAAEKILENPSGKVVLKNSRGQAGQEIRVMECKDLLPSQLGAILKQGGFDLVEEYILQHPHLMTLSSSGLNTIRVISQVINGQVEILAARLRITINSFVDNMAAGNVAAPVDIRTGEVTGLGVFSDISKADISIHPVTGVKIPGFRIPFWDEVITMVREAALHTPDNRSIGWDVAVTSSGPLLIEGNHNWCKLLWQLPVRKGLKSDLEKYL